MKPKAKVTAERHGGKIAIVEQQSSPNLVAAEVYFGFQDSDLAGLAVKQMRSDAMVPILKSGDYALIDTRDTNVGAGTFAVLLDNKSVVIMQLHRVYESGHSTDRVRSVYPNPVYGSSEFTLGEGAKIVGRVVQKVTRHL
jgi:phage repressor protein C with HTH and peptisase S24 domain